MTSTRFFFALTMITLALPAIASAQLELAPEQPRFAQPPAQPIAAEQPVEVAREEPQPDGSFTFGVWAEMMDLEGLELTMRAPEVAAITGVVLDRSWQGMQALREPVLGGVMVSGGMRMDGWLRGPDIRVFFGGSSIDENSLETPWVRAPGSELELSIQGVLALRTELAMGVQAPLGIFRPYVQARFGVGGEWVSVGVRDARLGTLGFETVDQVLFELGVEAGFAFLIADGLELGFGVRASINQSGSEAIGGILTVSFVENDPMSP